MITLDLRSDTVTRPTPALRDAMARAEVGDDVFGDDPTVRALEERLAVLLGHDRALFVPSGTMANQIAIRAQTQPGDQVVVEAGAHIYRYEGGGPAALSGVHLTPVPGEGGALDPDAVEAALLPDDPHYPAPALVCAENTHNRAGGRVVPVTALRALSDRVHARGLRLHLDGARLWNASVATGVPMAEWGALVDTVSVCFSKGMGCPIGSALIGDAATLARAHRIRKQWGGGMRQVGILAAAVLHALDHHFDRLAEDHANARRIAEAVDHPALRLRTPPETNIVLFDVDAARPVETVLDFLRERGILASTMGPGLLRLVTHLDLTADDCERAAGELNSWRP